MRLSPQLVHVYRHDISQYIHFPDYGRCPKKRQRANHALESPALERVRVSLERQRDRAEACLLRKLCQLTMWYVRHHLLGR